VSATAIILVGSFVLAVFVAVPVLILAISSRSGRSSRLPTALALTLWLCTSVGLAGVWFLVAVVAHKVDESLTNSWIIANAIYPAVGLGIVLTHRRLLR
jgi:hypothetical protein